MARMWGWSKRGRSAKDVWAAWQAADEVGDADRASELAAELLTIAPDTFVVWFEAGLLSKALGDWPEAVRRNERALSLFTSADADGFDGVNPAAWNLGIAATAVGDWPTARRAWQAYGITGIDPGSDPIDVDFGMAPIRLNPDRPSLTHQRPLDLGATEVVWCWRRSPAHAVVASVPLPESGHRFRDVVLHDGEPKGSRRLGDREASVFDELALLASSEIPTWQAQITGASPDDLNALGDLMGARGLGVDEWSGIRVMCSECSHGSPDTAHAHEPAAPDATRVGLAGQEDDLIECLELWRAERPRVEVLDLARLC